MRRAGFTLFEMLLVVGISAVVMSELVMVLVGFYRLEKEKLWDAELESSLRVARENLLFRAVSGDGDRYYAGVLSSTNFVWSSPHITAAFQYAEDPSQGGVGENEDVSERFLVQNVDDGTRDVPPVFVTNNLFFLNTEVVVKTRTNPQTGAALESTNRAERIAVSAFGKMSESVLDTLGQFIDLRDFESDLDSGSESPRGVEWIP